MILDVDGAPRKEITIPPLPGLRLAHLLLQPDGKFLMSTDHVAAGKYYSWARSYLFRLN